MKKILASVRENRNKKVETCLVISNSKTHLGYFVPRECVSAGKN
jgi:hypothetical protein